MKLTTVKHTCSIVIYHRVLIWHLSSIPSKSNSSGDTARTAPTLKTTTFSGYCNKKAALAAVFCSSQRGLIHLRGHRTGAGLHFPHSSDPIPSPPSSFIGNLLLHLSLPESFVIIPIKIYALFAIAGLPTDIASSSSTNKNLFTTACTILLRQVNLWICHSDGSRNLFTCQSNIKKYLVKSYLTY